MQTPEGGRFNAILCVCCLRLKEKRKDQKKIKPNSGGYKSDLWFSQCRDDVKEGFGWFFTSVLPLSDESFQGDGFNVLISYRSLGFIDLSVHLIRRPTLPPPLSLSIAFL